jgi:hypothetical protein
LFQWWAVERARAYSKYEAILKKFNATKSFVGRVTKRRGGTMGFICLMKESHEMTALHEVPSAFVMSL